MGTRQAAVMVALALSGCAYAGVPAPALRAGEHVYHFPAESVRLAVESLLREEGFTLVPTDSGPLVHTHWKWLIDGDEFASTSVRYVVLVKRLTKEHCRVEIVRVVRNTVGMETYHPLSLNNPGREGNADARVFGKGLVPLASGPRTFGRDLVLEWKLLQRLDPAAARRIEAQTAAQR